MSNEITLTPIGYIDSPYKEKFAIPRQPGLVPSAKGKIILEYPYNNIDLVRGLDAFSHLWVIFNFHATQQQGWKPLVRPPRLGGNKKLGVLATRSTFRPNPIGMSVVKLEDIKKTPTTIEIYISSFDLLDKTPVLDIKPYIQYSDTVINANSGFANNAPDTNINVKLLDEVKNFTKELASQNRQYLNLNNLIVEVLQQDPRPAYKKGTVDNKVYGMKLYNLNILWQFNGPNNIEVFNIEILSNT